MSPANYPISLKWLLGLYLIIPLCLLIQLVDTSLFGGRLQQELPTNPNEVFLYNFLFGTPHILASSLILATNREYSRFYQTNILLASALIIGCLSVGVVFLSYKALFIIIATLSVAHVIKQQVGIGNMTCRLSGITFQLWIWSGIATGAIIFNAIFIRGYFSPTQLQGMENAIFILLIPYCALTLINHQRIKNKKGVYFLWANFSLVAASAYLYFTEYFFLAVLAPRIIHDLTAFSVYVVHDRNRHHPAPQNRLFQFARQQHIPLVLVTPFLALLLAYLLHHQLDTFISTTASHLFQTSVQIGVALGLVTFCNLMHYYTETFTWGAGSPYRKHVLFKG